MNGHRSDLTKKTLLPVSQHFVSPGHSLEDLGRSKIYIIDHKPSWKENQRKKKENFGIRELRTLHPESINTKSSNECPGDTKCWLMGKSVFFVRSLLCPFILLLNGWTLSPTYTLVRAALSRPSSTVGQCKPCGDKRCKCCLQLQHAQLFHSKTTGKEHKIFCHVNCKTPNVMLVNDINFGSTKVIQWVPRRHKVLTHGQERIFRKVTSVSIHSFVEWLDTLCGDKRCKCCLQLQHTQLFHSKTTGKEYKIFCNVNCKTPNVDYLWLSRLRVLLWNSCVCCNWRQHLQRLSPHGLHWPTVDEDLDTAALTSVSLILLGRRNATTGKVSNHSTKEWMDTEVT
jgi:hypothetical protein